MEGITGEVIIKAAALIAGGIALGFAGLGVGNGQGTAAGKAAEAVGRNPEAEGKIRTMMLLGQGVAESAAIYGLLAFLLAFFLL